MPIDPTYKISISATRNHLDRAGKLIHYILTLHGVNDQEADVIEIAVSEACENAIRHGNAGQQPSAFDLELIIGADALKAVVVDNGKAFDFESIKPFSIENDFHAYKNGGLGIPLIKTLMDDVQYRRTQQHTNELTLIKYFKPKRSKGT